MATMRMLVLALGHYFQGMARLSARLVVDPDFAMFCLDLLQVLSHCLHSKAWPDCVYRCCPYWSSLAQRGKAIMRMLVLALGHFFQGEALPDGVERVVVEHDFSKHMVRLSRVWFNCLASQHSKNMLVFTTPSR